MRPQCILGMDIGGTNVRAGLVDRENHLYHFRIINTQSMRDGVNGKSFVENLTDRIEAYIRTHGDRFDVVGISAGFPSTIDKSRRVVPSTPNIEGLNDVPIADILEKRLGIPAYVNRDVNMLFYRDLHQFHIDNCCIALGCYIGTGFGNAVYVRGEILQGKNGAAGELGHIPIAGLKTRCGCGNESCAETIASGRYLEALAAEKFPDVPIGKVFTKYADHPLIQEFIEYLSLPVAAEINIFDPDYIVLGGGILQMEHFPVDALEKYIVRHSRKPYPAENLTLLYSEAAQENGVLGAGIYGFAAREQANKDSALQRRA